MSLLTTFTTIVSVERKGRPQKRKTRSYQQYTFRFATNNNNSEATHRHRHVAQLHAVLKKQCTCMLPDLQERSFRRRFDEDLLQRRLISMELFVTYVVNHPHLQHTEAVRAFVAEGQWSTYYRRATRPQEEIQPMDLTSAPTDVLGNWENEVDARINTISALLSVCNGLATIALTSIRIWIEHQSHRMQLAAILGGQTSSDSLPACLKEQFATLSQSVTSATMDAASLSVEESNKLYAKMACLASLLRQHKPIKKLVTTATRLERRASKAKSEDEAASQGFSAEQVKLQLLFELDFVIQFTQQNLDQALVRLAAVQHSYHKLASSRWQLGAETEA